MGAETYWTSERIFDICDKYSDIITFDSSGNLHVFWTKTKYEDAFPGNHPPMKFHRGYLYYSQFDAEENHIITTEISRAKFLSPICPLSINTYIDDKLILSWAANCNQDVQANKLGIFDKTGRLISKIYGTASKSTRISYDSSGNIFVIQDYSRGIYNLKYDVILSNKIFVHKKIGNVIEIGNIRHSFSLQDFSIISLDSNSVLIGIRIESYEKEPLKKVSTTKDRFVLLRLNAQGEKIKEPAIINLRESAYSVIEGAWPPSCFFIRLKDGSIVLVAGSMDKKNTIYQVKFTKNGKLVKTNTPIKKEIKVFRSIKNMIHICIQKPLEPLKAYASGIKRCIYGFDEDGNIYYAKQEKEKKYK